MTTFDRFDPFERRIGEALEGIAPAQPLDYLDDVFRQTVRTSQRPRWSFPERWFNVDIAIPRSAFGGRVPLRTVIVLLVVAALIAVSLAFYIGSQRRFAPPFGPAANGAIAFGSGGDIFVTDTTGSHQTLLIGGSGDQLGPGFSPDGSLVSYDNIVNGEDHLWVVGADGKNPRQVFDHVLTNGDSVATSSWVSWSGDSRHIAIVTPDKGEPQLWIASVDGADAKRIDLGGLTPNRGAVWDPLVEGRILVRAVDNVSTVGLYFVDTATNAVQQLHVPWPRTFGSDWDLSGQTFSDDGQRIAFNVITPDPALDPQGFYRIGLVNRDGSNPRILPGPTDHSINEGWPIFSPDGHWISAQRFAWNDASGLRESLAVLPSDGSAIGHDVIPAGKPGGATFDATWAPDASKLVAMDQGREVAYLIDPVTGDRQVLPWLQDVVAWQRLAP